MTHTGTRATFQHDVPPMCHGPCRACPVCCAAAQHHRCAAHACAAITSTHKPVGALCSQRVLPCSFTEEACVRCTLHHNCTTLHHKLASRSRPAAMQVVLTCTC